MVRRSFSAVGAGLRLSDLPGPALVWGWLDHPTPKRPRCLAHRGRRGLDLLDLLTSRGTSTSPGGLGRGRDVGRTLAGLQREVVSLRLLDSAVRVDDVIHGVSESPGDE